MHHDMPLIATVAMGLVLAFAFGFAATRLRLPPLVGYLLAGVALGPHTPGIEADLAMAGQLAEIGVILLMFGVGLHFSAADLMAVRRIAILGAVAQIGIATAIGTAAAMAWGWSLGSGLVLGLALSVASTVVLLRALDERNAVATVNGRIAVGWLIVEDLAMVLVLVLLPAFAGLLGGDAGHDAARAGGWSVLRDVAITLGKVALFVAIALAFGPRVVPWILAQVARAGSRELFTLSVLALALGIAFGSAALFSVSFALGAFFAGVVLSESRFSHKAAEESLPLQDAFAVLFFVSVGMLFDPSILWREPLAVIAVLLLILVGKSIAAAAIVRIAGFPLDTALTVSASLAQIGEFSFILAGLGIALGLLPPEGRDLILAGALLSITLNPLVFAAMDAAKARFGLELDDEAAAANPRLAALKADLDEVRRKQEARIAKLRLEVQELVTKFPMFASLAPEEREELLNYFRPRRAAPGERVIRKGDRADAVYFISEGSAQVSVNGRTFLLGPGDFFGEMGLLTGGRRSADVTAIDYCELLRLDQRDFRQFIQRHPALRSVVHEMAAKREEINRQIEQPAAAEASNGR